MGTDAQTNMVEFKLCMTEKKCKDMQMELNTLLNYTSNDTPLLDQLVIQLDNREGN